MRPYWPQRTPCVQVGQTRSMQAKKALRFIQRLGLQLGCKRLETSVDHNACSAFWLALAS